MIDTSFELPTVGNESIHVRLFQPALATHIDLLKAIAKQLTLDERDEPFYVVNLSELVTRIEAWRALLPRVKLFYAVKCNDNAGLLRTLAELGASFDCASQAEIRRVLALGVSAERIVYANPCKQLSMLRYARSQGVHMLTFDNADELRKIRDVYPEAKLLLRMLPPAVAVQCVLGNKFGATEEQARSLIELASDLKLDLVGVSFHVGSGCRDPRGFSLAVTAARRIWNLMQAKGYAPNVLDVGGGFPGTDPTLQAPGANPHLPDEHHEPGPTFDMMARALREALDEHFPESENVQLIAEPGRYLATAAFTLCCNVIARKDLRSMVAKTGVQLDASDELVVGPLELSPKDEAGTSTGEQVPPGSLSYYINDGVYGSFNCLFFDHAIVEPHYVSSAQENGECARFASTLYGPTCDGIDVVLRDYPMPELRLGDWVYFEAMGAYTVAAASNFNGMPVPQPYYLLQSRHAYLFERVARDMPAFALAPQLPLSPRLMHDHIGLGLGLELECNLSDERAQPEPLFGAVTVTLNNLDINERPRTPEPSDQFGMTPIGLSALFETCSESSENSSDYQSIDFAFGTIYWRE
jgi:ornithine decarboxylase